MHFALHLWVFQGYFEAVQISVLGFLHVARPPGLVHAEVTRLVLIVRKGGEAGAF